MFNYLQFRVFGSTRGNMIHNDTESLVEIAMRLSVLLILIFINGVSVYANDSAQQSYPGKKIESETLADSLQKGQLDLTVDPELIKESEAQQKTVEQRDNPLLPELINKKAENDVSLDGQVLIKDERNYPEVIDGVGVSIEVKRD